MLMIFLFLNLLTNYVFSQDSLNPKYGAYIGVGFNSHLADFQQIPDCPSCSPGYKTGNGIGVNFGITYDYPIMKNIFLSNKLLYKNLSADLISIETTTLIVEGVPTKGEFKHQFNSSLGVVGIESVLEYKLTKSLNLGVGLNLSYLSKKNYSQSETIIKPVDSGTFLNPDGTDSYSRIRNKYQGRLSAANSIYLAPVLLISYDLPLNQYKTLFLEPEFSYYFGLTNIVGDELVKKWTACSFNLGLSLKYSPGKVAPKSKIYREEYNVDTVYLVKENVVNIYSKGIDIEKEIVNEDADKFISTKHINRVDTIFSEKIYQLNGSLNVVGIDENGNEVINPQINIEEYISNRLEPILNYIFFNDNSSEISERYIKLNESSTKEFNVNSLFRDSTLQIYYNLLNIIGNRMLEYPNATIQLVGCNSNLDKEKSNLDLSRDRANTIKNYFINVWNIDSNRILIQTRNLPDKASTPINEVNKIAEKRRVEIYSSNPKILEPIFIEKIDKKSNIPLISYKLNSLTEAGLKSWELKSFQESNTQNYFRKSGSEIIDNSIVWNLSANRSNLPSKNEVLKSELTLLDKKGKSLKIKGNDIHISIKDTKVKGSDVLETFKLILFDFDKANIENQNLTIVDLINDRITKNSEVIIEGFTDRTGDPKYNQKLSQLRAEATLNGISFNLRSKVKKTQGFGSSVLLYNNDLPEGRFYCRTVVVKVKSKIE